MILAAGLLVLAGLVLFVGGILTGMTALYWGCVAACVVAAVLLYLARRTLGTTRAPATGTTEPARAPAASTEPADGTTATPEESAESAGSAATTANGATAAPVAEPAAQPAAQPARAVRDLPDPPVEEVEVTDLLMVVDLTDEVLVIDERPRYHLPGCKHLVGHTGIPLPLDEARTDGFTPCAVCTPDRNLAQRARERKSAGSN
ncbi:MAG TPA: hypothetical protein VFG13_15645 [Blastococcus sp.]|nr:hypothetical protein [Blastococcus sp.]